MSINEQLVKYILSKYIHLKEQQGVGTSQTILNWVKKYFPKTKDDGEVPYCSIALRECLIELGFAESVKTQNPLAISWRTFGLEVSNVKDAQYGDVVITDRGGGKYHVSLFLRYIEARNTIVVLGFNQSNMCNVMELKASLIKHIRRA